MIDLGLLNSDALLLVIEFLYTGRTEVDFTVAKDVLKVVSHLGLSDSTLLEKLSAYVVEHLNAKNCLGWFDFSSQLRMTSIKEKANSIMMRRFADVLQGAEFLDLSSDQLADYMKRKLDEQDADRDQVLKAVVRWITHCVDSRKEHFEEIVKMIDLTKCSADVLKTIFDNHGAVLISSTHLLQEFTSAALSLATAQQPKFKMIVTGGQFRKDKCNQKTWRLNLINGECVEKAPHTAEKFGVAFCSCPKGAICTGGALVNEPSAATTDCVLYDVKTDSWVVLTQLEAPTTAAGAVCIGDSKLMIVGGHGGRMKQACCLDLRKGTWTKCPDLLQGVAWPAVGCVDKSVFVIFPTSVLCKHERRGSEVSLQCFNTATSCWSFKTPLPDSVSDTTGTKAVTLAGLLYLVGGSDRICVRYNPTIDAWTVMARSLQQHWGGAALVMNDKIIICGGEKDRAGTDGIEEYDPSTNTWRLLSVKLPESLFKHGVIPV